MTANMEITSYNEGSPDIAIIEITFQQLQKMAHSNMSLHNNQLQHPFNLGSNIRNISRIKREADINASE